MVPEGTYRRITPRSSLAVKHSINIAVGVIDPDYHSEIKAILVNNGQFPYTVTKGERVAQLILENAQTDNVILMNSLDETTRGSDRFRLTGMTTKLADI